MILSRINLGVTIIGNTAERLGEAVNIMALLKFSTDRDSPDIWCFVLFKKKSRRRAKEHLYKRDLTERLALCKNGILAK